MKKLIILFVFCAFSFNIQAQRDQIKEKIEAQKVAFITERLDLSVTEAQQFWPIYNAYEKRIHSMRRNDLKEVRESMREGNLSESVAQKLLDKFMLVEDNMHKAKKQLVKDLSSVLPAQKIIALKASEDAFNKKLMQTLQQRREKMKEMRNRN